MIEPVELCFGLFGYSQVLQGTESCTVGTHHSPSFVDDARCLSDGQVPQVHDQSNG